MLHAAAPCPVPLKRAFMDFVGAEKVWEYYGASEGGGTVISPQEWLEHPGSVGRPFPGTEFVILDDDGNALPAGEVGTVWVNPAGSSFEYHNDAEKTAATHRDRFFTVGDAGYLDDDGYLYLTDRKSDMVITGRRERLPARDRGVPARPRRGRRLRGARPARTTSGARCSTRSCSRQPGSTLDEDGVVAYVREHMADYKRPRIVELVDELPARPERQGPQAQAPRGLPGPPGQLRCSLQLHATTTC